MPKIFGQLTAIQFLCELYTENVAKLVFYEPENPPGFDFGFRVSKLSSKTGFSGFGEPGLQTLVVLLYLSIFLI